MFRIIRVSRCIILNAGRPRDEHATNTLCVNKFLLAADGAGVGNTFIIHVVRIRVYIN